MGLKLTPMPVRDLLGLLDLSGPIVDASSPTTTVYVCFPPPAQSPNHLSPCYSGLKIVHTRKIIKTAELYITLFIQHSLSLISTLNPYLCLECPLWREMNHLVVSSVSLAWPDSSMQSTYQLRHTCSGHLST